MRNRFLPIRPLVQHPTDPTILLVTLTQGYTAMVDNTPHTLEHVAPYNWILGPKHGGPQGLRRVMPQGTTTLLHTAILPTPKGHGIHFKNGDKLDCRLSNMEIRPLGDIQRQYNAPKTTGYTQCVTRSGALRYRAQGSKHGKMYHLGMFATPEDARAAYDQFRGPVQ